MMKKIANYILTAALTAALSFTPAVSAYSSVVNFDYELAVETYTQVENTLIFAEEDVPQEIIDAAVSGWVHTPMGVRQKLAEYGCNIYLSFSAQSSEGTNTEGEAHYAKISYYGPTLEIAQVKSTPYIIALSMSQDPEGTVLHEIAHILDMTIALLEDGKYEDSYYRISTCEKWQMIYNTYADTLAGIDAHASVNMYTAQEAFAECFRLAYQKPEALIEACPAAYEFILCMVERYAG